MIDFKAEAKQIFEDVVALRRDFHRHPELAFEEFRTAGIVAEELNRLGLEVQTGVGKTGVVGILEGEQDGPTILYRADMDALPIQEANEVEYASVEAGKMHACGHDGHTAIALGIARIFAAHRDQIAGRIKFVFQPAEETVGGADAMVADGALENPRPEVSLGLHLWNAMPIGKVGAAEGPVMAGASIFDITITGVGGHAAAPHTTADPVVCAAQLIGALQTINSRNLDPFDSAVVSVTKMQASEAYNIIPEQVHIAGTFRTFRLEVRDLVERRIHEISEQLCAAMGCRVHVETSHGTLPVSNDSAVAKRLHPHFASVVGAENLLLDERTMGSEDVGSFMVDIPGLYFFVGSANEERGLNYAHHHPRFDFDEAVLPVAMELMSLALAEYVMR